MKKLLICFMALAIAISITGCGRNSENTDTLEQTTEQTAKYFSVTVTELVDTLKNEWDIALKPFTVIDDKNNSKIATYTFSTENDSIDTMMHYQITYNDTTKQVSDVMFFFSKNFMGDITSAHTRYLYHTATISGILSPDINIDELYEKIDNVNGVNEGYEGTAIYENEDFRLFASCDTKNFSALFTPIEN